MRIWSSAAVAICVGGILAAGALERRSVERANRLYRGGEPAEAARTYADRAGNDTSALALLYNLGTSLLDLGSPAAAPELRRAGASEDPTLRARAFYNLGLWNLRRARDAAPVDSVRAYALASADANRAVLRLEPGRPDARWNLALAMRMLDSINADDGRSGTETVDGSNDSDDRTLSDDLREFEDPSVVDQAPRQGSDEALAASDEPDPLSALEAEAILVADPDRSIIVRKLLTYEGRTQRRPLDPRPGSRTAPRW
ncbi:MAG: hypothetical protein AB7T31_12510 [Gemmatimonadales bacterium]